MLHSTPSLLSFKYKFRLSSSKSQPLLCPFHRSAMVENGKKIQINSHPIIYCPTSSGVSEVSARAKRAVRSKRTSDGERERVNRRASGPVLQSVFLIDLDHGAEKKLPAGSRTRTPDSIISVCLYTFSLGILYCQKNHSCLVFTGNLVTNHSFAGRSCACYGNILGKL